MIFLTVATALVGIVTSLEFFDPGIFSTAMPVPVLWAALFVAWAIHGTRVRRGKPAPTAVRVALTAVVGLTTMPVVLLAVRDRAALPWALCAAVLVAGATWALTDPQYADHPLQKNRPR